MRRLHVVMPMGGLGSRFSTEGWNVPKPLIPVGGMPMFRRALSSFDAFPGPWTVSAVIRREVDASSDLRSAITAACPGAAVVVIDALTRGAVETALAAQSLIHPDDGLLVLDCDLWFSSRGYLTAIADVLAGEKDVVGVLLTFPAHDARYSYAELDGKRVLRTAEKQVISQHALAGAYFFSFGSAFVSAAHELLSMPLDGECYTSLVYNILLARGGTVVAEPVDRYASFGTPSELARSDSEFAYQ